MRRHRPQRARPIDVPAGPAVETVIEAVGGEGDGIAAGPLYAPFTLPGERFLLGFNMPNFQFHATTFYGILRMTGVPLGKRDYMGAP